MRTLTGLGVALLLMVAMAMVLAPPLHADDQVLRVIETSYVNPALIALLFGGTVIYDQVGYVPLGNQGPVLGGAAGFGAGGYGQAGYGPGGYGQTGYGQRGYGPPAMGVIPPPAAAP